MRKKREIEGGGDETVHFHLSASLTHIRTLKKWQGWHSQSTKHRRNLMEGVKKNWKWLILSILLSPTTDELEVYQAW